MKNIIPKQTFVNSWITITFIPKKKKNGKFNFEIVQKLEIICRGMGPSIPITVSVDLLDRHHPVHQIKQIGDQLHQFRLGVFLPRFLNIQSHRVICRINN